MATANITPINLLAKYAPPTISLQYTIEGQNMQYVHEMPFIIEQVMTPEIAYEQLLSAHKLYLDPSILNKTQVVNLLNKIFANNLQQISKQEKQKENIFQKRNAHKRNEPNSNSPKEDESDYKKLSEEKKQQLESAYNQVIGTGLIRRRADQLRRR